MAKDSSGTIILLGAAAVGVYGYLNGWFTGLFGTTAAAVAAPVPTPVVVPTATAPTPVPPLGTTVTNVSDALRQVAANDAYILPDAATFATLQTALPGGYNWIMTTDKGGILLRPDVYAAVQTSISGLLARATAAGAATSSLQAAGQVSLAQIQSIMASGGLSGFGDFQRHMASRTGRYRAARFQ